MLRSICLFFAFGWSSNILGSQAINIAKPHSKDLKSSDEGDEAPEKKKPEACSVDGQSRRVAWVHIPKTGTSLGTMIAHYANPSLPTSAAIPDCQHEVCTHVSEKNLGQIEFQYRYPTQRWFKDCFWMKGGNGPDRTDWMSHKPITDETYQSFEGRFIGFFRNPRQRALSSFYSFEDIRLDHYGITSEEKWARLIEGTATKMLAGQQFPIEVSGKPNDEEMVPDLKLAISRLDGFMMIGLVEHYELSVCLFHWMTGSAWGAHDAENMRQRRARIDEEWDETGLNGFVDRYDARLYIEAKKRFWNAIHEHGLTNQKCHSLCPGIEETEFI